MSFHIQTPSGVYYAIDHKGITYEERLSVVSELLDIHKNYINKFNNKVSKRFLFDCATYLLFTEKETNTLGRQKSKSIKRREIPVSNLKNKGIEDYFYSGTSDELEEGFVNFEFESVDQNFIGDYEAQLIDELYTHKRSDRNINQWKNSFTYKMNMLYSCDDIYNYVTDDTVTTYKADEIDNSKNFTNSIKPNKVLVHKGRKGIIDKNKLYLSQWIYLDNDNEFEFNSQRYSVKQIQDYQIVDNKSDMDELLAIYIPHEDKTYFFNEDVKDISNKVLRVNYTNLKG